jgi:ATP-dependent exoDNAse (exonuclease V) beta subunit
VSERTPTPEQAAGIEASEGVVLLEAGAGAGKTGVMVDRYCRLACDEGVPVEEILAITFTEKAASELRQRVRAELLVRADGGSARARELLGMLGGAWITTIHGFCHRLISIHPVAAGVDPRFGVLDAAETERAAREAFDEALEAFLDEQGAAGEETVAAFGVDSLRGMVVGGFEELRSRGFAEPRLTPPPKPDPGPAIRKAERVAIETESEMGPKSAARPLIEHAIATIGERGEAVGLDEIAELRSDSDALSMAAYRNALDAATARVAEAGAGHIAYEQAGILLERFAGIFRSVKERRRGVDFEDLQILATGLLEEGDLREMYRAQFSQIMVDEFQDTNRLQLGLIEALRGPGTSLMLVGDALQSIYGFRHADLDVFREQRRRIAERPDGRVIELSGNFRSSPAVIGAVNEIGSRLIGDEYRALRVGSSDSEPPAGDGPAVEILLTAKKGWEDLDLEPALDATTPPRYLAEARFLARRLRALAEEGVPRGEMVVLLRAFTHLDAYEDSLARVGLRPYVVGGRGYWSQQQVSDVCALLALIANPLDDQALFGALASPACGASPDTLWLLRRAAGEKLHVWPALEHAVGAREAEPEHPERLEQIGADEIALLRRFAGTVASLRDLGTRVPLADLIDRAITETGYDLAVLLKPAGEARLANVRKLMQIAEQFEADEGRDLRGLLDFLAFREEAADESAAATAAEDHDGVRIMSIHRAKGLEFGVVAVPHLDRSLLAGSWPPLLTFGHGEDERLGMQLRRLGARAINLYDHEALRDEANDRDAEEGLRLFHVAATRAERRLILSGVIKEQAGEEKASTPVIERIVESLEIDRGSDSVAQVPAPEPRPGLDATFDSSEIAVTVNLPSAETAAALTARAPAPAGEDPEPTGPAPLLERRTRSVPRRPLSYSAISEYEKCGYRFQMEKVFGFGREPGGRRPEEADAPISAREERTAYGRVAHALLEWSQIHGWRVPEADLVRSHALGEGLDPDSALVEDLSGAISGCLRSALFVERIVESTASARAEVPILLNVAGSILRGSIDLLVEDGDAPLVIDYKTDRLDGTAPGEHVGGYEIQRSIYALAVADARSANQVEVAYMFLERPEEPVVELFDREQMEARRQGLGEIVEAIAAGEFRPAPAERRDWGLCRGCPALGALCSGPERSG